MSRQASLPTLDPGLRELPGDAEISRLDFRELGHFLGAAGLAVEIDRTVDLLTDGSLYLPLSRTADGKKISTCIDPRTHEDMRVAIQSPGGAPGEATDTVYTRFGDVAKDSAVGLGDLILVGLVHNRKQDHGIVHGAHWGIDHTKQHAHGNNCGCKFADAYMAINEEIADPKDELTMNLAMRWADMYGVRESHLERVRETAAELVRRPPISGPEMITRSDQVYPQYANITTMVGPNRAGVYAVNHLPTFGLNRVGFHQAGLPVQAYHDSLGASARVTYHEDGVDKETKRVRTGARILRTAATATVLRHYTPELEIVEISGTGRLNESVAKGVVLEKL